jgi:four helix bundle protein
VTPEELCERLLDFAVMMGRIVDLLPDTRLGRHVAGQLVRCGTSPAANYAEGCAAESRADFVHKLNICRKELRETRMWLRLILKVPLLPADKVAPAFDECSQLCRIFASSVLTAKRGQRG